MKKLLSISLITLSLAACGNSQIQSTPKLVGGPCEGCEAVFEYDTKALSPVDTLPDFFEVGQKIKLTGTIYQNDGKTPAKDVILYFYHTNQEGLYLNKNKESNWSERHGYIRGWIKTNVDGKYSIYTLKPGAYPGRSNPPHIHPTILEPNGKYYWVESYHFKGDPFLIENELNPKSPRGGSSGLMTLTEEGNHWIAKRDYILGKNIPDYD